MNPPLKKKKMNLSAFPYLHDEDEQNNSGLFITRQYLSKVLNQ